MSTQRPKPLRPSSYGVARQPSSFIKSSLIRFIIGFLVPPMIALTIYFIGVSETFQKVFIGFIFLLLCISFGAAFA